MDKPKSHKAIKSKDDIKEIIKKKKRMYYIPSKGVTVEADTPEKAASKL